MNRYLMAIMLAMLVFVEWANTCPCQAEEFYKWSMQGDLDAFTAWADKASNLNVVDKNGYGVFRWPILFIRTDIVEFLIKRGADVNFASPVNGETPLHYAAAQSTTFAVGKDTSQKQEQTYLDLLLSSGAKADQKDKKGQTPIFWADNTGSIQKLIKAGANINEQDNNGNTVLHCAAKSGRLPRFILALIKLGADTKIRNQIGKTPYEVALSSESFTRMASIERIEPKSIEALFSGKEVLGVSDVDAIAEHGTIEQMKELMEQGLKLTRTNELILAARNEDHPEMIQLLVDAGANIKGRDNNQNTPLHIAASCNKNEVACTLLIKAGISVNTSNDGRKITPLHNAVWSNSNINVIKTLLDAGADVNAKTFPDKATPLHFAIERKRDTAIVALLLKYKADVNAQAINRITPLQMAQKNGDEKIISLLTAAGARGSKSSTSTSKHDEHTSDTKKPEEKQTTQPVERTKKANFTVTLTNGEKFAVCSYMKSENMVTFIKEDGSKVEESVFTVKSIDRISQ